MLAALHNNKRNAGGDPHVDRYTRQARWQPRQRPDRAGPRVDPRRARASRYELTRAPDSS